MKFNHMVNNYNNYMEGKPLEDAQGAVITGTNKSGFDKTLVIAGILAVAIGALAITGKKQSPVEPERGGEHDNLL